MQVLLHAALAMEQEEGEEGQRKYCSCNRCIQEEWFPLKIKLYHTS